jgi:hypothetical protein
MCNKKRLGRPGLEYILLKFNTRSCNCYCPFERFVLGKEISANFNYDGDPY